jgi:Methyltransferase domain
MMRDRRRQDGRPVRKRSSGGGGGGNTSIRKKRINDTVVRRSDAGSSKLPRSAMSSATPPKTVLPIMRAEVKRLEGVELKDAELVTRRLLLSGLADGAYSIPPTASNDSSLLSRFLSDEDANALNIDHALTGFAVLHPALDPASRGNDVASGRAYGVPARRATRKRQQIAAMVSCAAVAIEKTGRPGRLLDACGGCGHVGLVLAALFPDWSIVVVDAKPFALDVARKRAADAGLENVSVAEMDVNDLDTSESPTFDIALALHACGDASDVVLEKAMAAGAAAVVAPCCVGGVVSYKLKSVANVWGHEPSDRQPGDRRSKSRDWMLPRSAAFSAALTREEYSLLVRAADFGEELGSGDDWRRAAKTLVEADRAAWLIASGFEAQMVKMRPLTCSPKNDILLAWPQRQIQGDSTYVDDSWVADVESNKSLQAIVAAGGILNGFDLAKVTAVGRTLRETVVSESSPGEYMFPLGQGSRGRKIVHAVADSLGLHHCSLGTGRERCVVVSRTSVWPLFFQSYVGYGGEWVARSAQTLLSCGHVPAACAEMRNLSRSSRAHHITLVSAKEMGKIPTGLKRDWQALLGMIREVLNGKSGPVLVGLGCVAAEQLEGADVVDGSKVEQNEAYYGVVEWPAADEARHQLGLPVHDFHITVGFRVKDIHNVPKGRGSMLWTKPSANLHIH